MMGEGKCRLHSGSQNLFISLWLHYPAICNNIHISITIHIHVYVYVFGKPRKEIWEPYMTLIAALS